MTELHTAVFDGNHALVCEILENNPSCVNYRNIRGETALHEVYRPDKVDKTNQDNNRLQIIQTLLDYKVDVNILPWGFLRTALFMAVTRSQVKGVKLLLENGANPNIRMYFNCTVLHDAVRNEISMDIIELLLKHGAEINALNNIYYTPLDYAICFCLMDYAKFLIKAGAKVHCMYWSMLGACINEEEHMIKFLLSQGPDVDMHGQFSLKILYFTLEKEDRGIEERNFLKNSLLNQGIDIDALIGEGVDGMTELHLAAKEENEEQVLRLLKAGANVNAKNMYDDTPLHTLFDDKKKFCPRNTDHLDRIASLLLRYGADPSARNYLNYTPLHVAVKNNEQKFMNLILSKIIGKGQSSLPTEIRLKLWLNKVSGFCSDENTLMIALILGYNQIVNYFINIKRVKETDDHINKHLISLIHVAAIQNYQLNIIKIFLEAGHKVDIDSDFFISDGTHRNYEFFLRLTCLLWEFNDDSIVKTQLSVSVVDFHECQIELLHLYVIIDLRSKEPRADFVQLHKCLKLNRNQSNLLNRLNCKLDELKTVTIINNVSLYDILIKPLDSLVKFMKSKINFKACKKFILTLENKKTLESYEHIIKTRIDLVIERKRLLNNARFILSKIINTFVLPLCQLNVPDGIILMILSYLSVWELEIISAVP